MEVLLKSMIRLRIEEATSVGNQEHSLVATITYSLLKLMIQILDSASMMFTTVFLLVPYSPTIPNIRCVQLACPWRCC